MFLSLAQICIGHHRVDQHQFVDCVTQLYFYLNLKVVSSPFPFIKLHFTYVTPLHIGLFHCECFHLNGGCISRSLSEVVHLLETSIAYFPATLVAHEGH